MRKRISWLLVMLLCLSVIGVRAEGTGVSASEGGHSLIRFFFTRSGDMMPQSWEIVREDGGYILRENEEAERSFPQELVTELEQVLSDYHVTSWSGVYETEYEVLDGEGFALELAYADGTSVQASGENAFPDGYFSAVDAIMDILHKEKMSCLAGAYCYEGEGFGGNFTITLHADGTYIFHEGPLSSYIGMGTWDIFYDEVYMTEDGEGQGRSFVFGVKGDALIYLENGSDAFPSVQLEDEAQFMKQREGIIRVSDGTHTVLYQLNDSPSARSLYEMLPLDTEVENYGHNEKIFYPPQTIAMEDGIEGGGQAGALALFSPWGNVVMYYAPFGSYPGLYLLGEAIDGAEWVESLSGRVHIEAVQ